MDDAGREHNQRGLERYGFDAEDECYKHSDGWIKEAVVGFDGLGELIFKNDVCDVVIKKGADCEKKCNDQAKDHPAHGLKHTLFLEPVGD